MNKKIFTLIQVIVILGLVFGKSTKSRAEEREELEKIKKQIDYIDSQKSFSISGRGIMTSDNMFLTGLTNYVDTNSQQKKHINNLAVDLSLEKTIYPYITAHGTLRFQSDFDGFYVQGETFQIRDVWIEGYIYDFIRLRAGNFDIKHTPFTFFIEEKPFGYRSEIFDAVTETALYNSYHLDEVWNLQGFELNAALKIKDFAPMDSINLYASLTPYGDLTFKKFITTARAGVSLRDIYSLDYRLVDFQDRSDKTPATPAPLHSQDMSIHSISAEGDFGSLFGINKEERVLGLGVNGEFAASLYRGYSDGSVSNGIATRAGAEIFFKNNLLKGRFQMVGEKFYNPAAQTPLYQSAYFDFENQPLLSSHIFSRHYNDEMDFSFANQIVADELIHPYGDATPNRIGASVEYINEMLSFADIEFRYDYYNEIETNGTRYYRSYTGLFAGAEARLDELHGMLPRLAYGFKLQKSTRDEDPVTNSKPENYTISSHSISLAWYPHKRVTVLGGLEAVKRNGFRWIDVQPSNDPFMRQHYFVRHDSVQTYLMTGLKLNVNKSSYIMFYYRNLLELEAYSVNSFNGHISILF